MKALKWLVMSLVMSSQAFAIDMMNEDYSKTDGWYGFYFRAGALFVIPTGKSQPVELANVQGPAELSVKNGPINGSYVTMGINAMPALTIGYALPFWQRQLSIETILALPFEMTMHAGGTLATQSLAPYALGNLPTGVPPLGDELGKIKVLPPVLTAVWRFLPDFRFHPYLGAGVSVLIPMEAKLTNPVLTEVGHPTLEVPVKAGFVIQAGAEVRLWKWFFLTGDFKYIAGFDIEAKVKNIAVKLPALPIFGQAKVGDNVVKMSVNPIILQISLGMDL